MTEDRVLFLLLDHAERSRNTPTRLFGSKLSKHVFKRRSVFIGYFEAFCNERSQRTPTTNERNRINAVIETCDFFYVVLPSIKSIDALVLKNSI